MNLNICENLHKILFFNVQKNSTTVGKYNFLRTAKILKSFQIELIKSEWFLVEINRCDLMSSFSY